MGADSGGALRAARGDAAHRTGHDPRESRRKLEVLRRHCEDAGRPYEENEKTAHVEVDPRPGRMSPADVVARLRDQAAEGIEHVIVNLPDAHELERLGTLGREVIPALAEVPAG